MMKTKLAYILSASVILLFPSCDRFHQMEVHDTARADSLMEAAHLVHDSDRILFLADSLASTGDFAPVKANYWRGYAHYSKWNHYLCRQYWYEGLELDVTSKEEMIYHGRTANRLADVLLTAGDYEAAMRVAIPAMEKMREEGISVSRDYGYLLLEVGCCELNNRNFEQADAYFDEAYELFMLLIEDNGEDGGSSHLDNLKTSVAGLTSIARHNLEKNRFEEVLTWADRLQYVMEDYRRQPETLQESLDRRETLCNFFRATALESLGRHDEAAAAFAAAMSNPFSTTPQGRVEGARYLMLAKRWEDAADSYNQLDGVANVFGLDLTLDNIQQYMLPKLRANLNARRNDQALATSIRLADALDSAIVRSKDDKAAELATVYHTQEIKEDFLQQKARLERERFVSSVGVIVLLIISFLVFVFVRYRSSIRLEEAYKQLEVANAHAQEASRVKTAFLQQISHEIRTPINLLSGFAQLLTTPGMELDEKSREEINEGVVKNTGRITGLISKILDLSDLISNPSLENKDSMTLGQIAEEAADSSGIRNNKDIHFDIMMADGVKDQTIVTNRKAVTRILGLLLENASKFTEKGMVSLRVVPKQSFVYFLVEDTGIGIPAEEAEHIFEHFVQLDDYQEGTGIGLSLARSLGRRLGGDVVLDTSYTIGARFIFSLPLNEE